MTVRTGADGSQRTKAAFWLSEETLDALDAIARLKGWSRRQVVEDAVRRYARAYAAPVVASFPTDDEVAL